MKPASFEEFAEFIRQSKKISGKTIIAADTRLEEDLGITGDDGTELLVTIDKRFGVALSSEEHGNREAFDLRPNEFLFHSEGGPMNLSGILRRFAGQPASVVVTLTAGDLYNALVKAPNR